MSNNNNTIEVLYFDDCPSWKNAQTILIELLEKLEISPEIILIKVETEEEAIKNKFTGSPMIKVNGEELFPTGQENYALGCRVFQTPEGYRGMPTKEMLSEKLNNLILLD